MDLESVTEELYGLRPDRFTAARNVRAAEARKAGDRALAEAVRSLRRPTLAAWVSNLLVRERPAEARSLAALGDGLRRAHRELDGERLRELSRKQHAVVAALARQARQLAADAGQPVGDDVQHEVEATLHAVLADPAAAGEWASGRLVRPLSAPVGFGAALTEAPLPEGGRGAGGRERSAERAAAPAQRPRGTGARRTGGRSAREGTVGGGEAKAEAEAKREREKRAAEERERAERERREQELREELRRAEEEAGAREDERERAGADRDRAEEGLREAASRVDALAAELAEAERARRTADEEVRTARRRFQDAERAAREARRRARDAAARAGRRGSPP
ncbi:hypothetical protein ACQI4E_27925 [Streptomyces sp. CA-252508]|uniref:hypothetical protein n=1 Tax=Streptomyces sp. CA-252508 TaxID=3418946 RepID=UPI003D94A166